MNILPIRIAAFVAGLMLVATPSARAGARLNAVLRANCILELDSTTERGPPGSELEKLRRYLQEEEVELGHAISISNGKAVLEIDHLMRSQKKFLLLVGRAVREGSVSLIDAGIVNGPKTMIMLAHLLERGLGDGKIVIEGVFDPAEILRVAKRQQAGEFSNLGEAYQWTASEIEDFEAAMKVFDVRRCRASELCRFRLVSRKGKASLRLKPYRS